MKTKEEEEEKMEEESNAVVIGIFSPALTGWPYFFAHQIYNSIRFSRRVFCANVCRCRCQTKLNWTTNEKENLFVIYRFVLMRAYCLRYLPFHFDAIVALRVVLIGVRNPIHFKCAKGKVFVIASHVVHVHSRRVRI